MASHKLMELMDENKEEIPNGLYLQFSNILKEKNKEEEEGKSIYIEIEYVYSEIVSRGMHPNSVILCSEKSIIRLTTSEYALFIREFKKTKMYWLKEKICRYENLSHNHRVEECDQCEEMTEITEDIINDIIFIGYEMLNKI